MSPYDTKKEDFFEIVLRWFTKKKNMMWYLDCTSKILGHTFFPNPYDSVFLESSSDLKSNTVKLGYNEQLGTNQICSL